MGAWRTSTEPQQSGHATRSGLEVKNGPEVKNGRKWRVKEARMRDSQRGGESDPAEGVRRRCMKNFPSPAPTSRRLNVVVRSPPLYPKSGPKWRHNYPEGPDHLVASNRLF